MTKQTAPFEESLLSSHPAFTYARSKLDEAITALHRTPDDEHRLAVADVGRFCWNVGASLARDAGQPTAPWEALLREARDAVNTPGFILSTRHDSEKHSLLQDTIYEMHRELRELRETVNAFVASRKKRTNTERKEAA